MASKPPTGVYTTADGRTFINLQPPGPKVPAPAKPVRKRVDVLAEVRVEDDEGYLDDPDAFELWLYPIPPELRPAAIAGLEQGDALEFLCKASNKNWLSLVMGNSVVLRQRGIFETALLHAFVSPAMNNRGHSLWDIAWMFEIADRAKLRAAGDPLPGSGPFVVYRGVSGRGRARRVRGMSWTANLELAKWFATRFCNFPDASRFADPAIFRTVVDEKSVLAYVNRSGRSEQEFIIQPPQGRLVRSWRLAEEPDREQELERIREGAQKRRLANQEKNAGLVASGAS